MNEHATTPNHLMVLFAERAAAGDIEGVMELYEPTAIFEDDGGQIHTGTTEIADALGPLVDMKPQISYAGDPRVITVADVALVSNDWSLSATAPDGSRIEVSGTSADVVRQQDDGSWLVLIDQPRGVQMSP